MKNCTVLLKKAELRLRAYCKKMNTRAAEDEKSEWCCDNYGLLLFALSNGGKYLKKKRSEKLDKLFFDCLSLCPDGRLPVGGNLVSGLASLKLGLFECESLPVILSAALAYKAAEGIKEDTPVSVNAVRSLISLGDTDLTELFYAVCKAERLLCDDPAGIYDIMTPETKSLYRRAVIKLAQKEHKDEVTVLREALEKAKKESGQKNHIGFFIGLERTDTKKGRIFLIAEAVFAAVAALLFGIALKSIVVGVLSFLPLFELLKVLSGHICGRLFPASPVFSLDCNAPGCPESEVLVAVSSVLPGAAGIKELYSHLEEIYISDYTKNTKVMLLCDLKSSDTPFSPSDDADIIALKRLITSLNVRYPGVFSAAVRDRVYSPTQNEYTGFERKRGALCTLIKYLKGGEDGFKVVFGDDGHKLSSVKYILALDSDTLPSFDVIRSLRAVAMHPLNAPVIDRREKKVVSGYGCFVPLIKTRLENAKSTFFTLLTGDTGELQYSGDIPERYMDMFGKSIFTGKGLIDADVFYEVITDSFEDEYILSHDILEGDSLRVAFCGRQVLYDLVPSKPTSYFARQHRWIRGDTQNLKYIFRPLKRDGTKKLSLLTKYQLADNFRRALTPVFSLALILFGALTGGIKGIAAVAVGVLAVVAADMLTAFIGLLSAPFSFVSAFGFSSDGSACGKALCRAVLFTGLLPYNAANSLDAVLRSLFRIFVSRKKLLEWVTASDSEHAGGRNMFLSAVFPVICACIFFFTGKPFLRLVAIITVLAAAFSQTDGIKLAYGRKNRLTEREREIVTAFCAASWRFFSDFVTKSDNWLPPDNVQETPVYRVAHRTSPTNIGLYLCCVLAAADMSFITAGELHDRVKNTLDTIDKLQKYNGNLLNWYDTVTLEPLSPGYVSAVDCGNFACSLTALKEGLAEYISADKRIAELCDRINSVLDNADLGFLYNPRRKLFHIGADAVTGEKSASFYDLYMSEARMTSYYEVARRNVPEEHWRSLGRTLVRSAGYAAAASWTGTMFEYFMPAMFLPVYENSFQAEALRACLDTQKRRAKKKNIPYGISESCYYAFDGSLNYKYKAHGIKKLALKRGADEESVISPYSVFLTLPFDKKAALKNLAKLSSLHCEGRCGFYEAVDFSEKNRDGDDCFIVRSYMSHHLGMSMISAANSLFDGIFIKRFISDVYMRSGISLLTEAMPSMPHIFRGIKEDGEKRPPLFFRHNEDEKTFSEAAAFGNGEWTLICDKYGRNISLYGGMRLFRFSERSKGVFAGINCKDGIIPMNFTGDCGNKPEKRSFHSFVEKDGFCADVAFCVHPNLPAMLIPVRIENKTDKKNVLGPVFYFEPELFPSDREDSHPAYSDMFIKCSYDKEVRALVFTALRHGENKECTVACGFYDRRDFYFINDREKVLGRDKNRDFPLFSVLPDDNSAVNTVFPCAAVYAPEELHRGEKKELVFIVTAGNGRNEALSRLVAVRKSALPELDGCAKNPFASDKRTAFYAESLLARRFFGAPVGKEQSALLQENKNGKNTLWSMGISGDAPIITVKLDSGIDISALRALIRLHKRLMRCGIKTDTVLLYEHGDDYFASGGTLAGRALKEEDAEGLAGISIISAGKFPKDVIDTLLAASDVIYPGDGAEAVVKKPGGFGFFAKKEYVGEPFARFLKGGFCFNGEVPVPWCHTLSNKDFGTLLSDGSLGFSWAYNSKLNPITAGSDNTVTEAAGEMLILHASDGVFDCMTRSRVFYGISYAEYESVCGKYTVKVRVEVPATGMKKHVSVSVSADGKTDGNVKIHYLIKPRLCEDAATEKYIKRDVCKNGVVFTNPFNTDYAGEAGLFCTAQDPDIKTEVTDILPPGMTGPYAAVGTTLCFGDKDIAETEFCLCFGKDRSQLIKTFESPFLQKTEKLLPAKNVTSSLGMFAGALLLHQVTDTRILARTGFYQCSGAFGFRDQLQDAGAVAGYYPELAKEILLTAASAQFLQGDVLHWFHVTGGKAPCYRGVRTRCSDDLLWLPYTLCDYIEKTGDRDILDVRVPFIEGEILSDGEKERYAAFYPSDKSMSLYGHALLAIKKGLDITPDGLMRLSGGDWNDSFNEAGLFNDTESVWLTMFMRSVCKRFANICNIKNDGQNERELIMLADKLAQAADSVAWNGEYYVRGFFDDKTPFGDKDGDGFKIDLICQAWASLCDMPDKARRKKALEAAYDSLCDEKNGIVKLYAPALTPGDRRLGYANFYPEGVRENGGQYTHAAVWFLTALRKEGLHDKADNVEKMLLPSEKYMSDTGLKVYKTEPYALCGDVYSGKGLEGRGGWSLYTGSAGWMVRYYNEIGRF